jgi:CBS domain-containing protein
MNTMQSSLCLISPEVEPLPIPAERRAPIETVCARASTSVVKVPSWFTVGAALRVAQLKSVAHLLVLDRGVVVGTISARTLASSPATEPLARRMTPSTVTVAPETARADAWRLMACLGLECLPVTSGPLLLGLVTSEDLAEDDQRAAG